MRFAVLACVCSLGLASLAGCGGGGAGGGGASGAPQVQGKVTRRSGSAAGLAGVTVTCRNTGESDTTGADGSFAFEVPTGETIQVTLRDGTLPAAGGGWDCDETGDALGDDVDAGESGVDLAPLEDGEVVVVEIELENGQIIECWVDGHGDGRGAGECPLLPDPTLAPDAKGELEVVRDGACVDLEVEVSGLAGAQALDVVLLTPRGEHQAGTLAVGDDGAGHFQGRVCADDLPPSPDPLPMPPVPELPPLPPGFPEDLAGLLGDLLDGVTPPTLPEVDPFYGAMLLLLDVQGQVLFVGFLPGPGGEPADGWSEPGHDGTGELPDPGTLPPEVAELLGLPGLPDDLGAALDDLLGRLQPH